MADNTDTTIELLGRLHVERGEAYRRGDVDGYISYYTSDATMFVLTAPMTVKELAHGTRTAFESGAQVLSLNYPAKVEMTLSPAGDAAIAAFAWRERFKKPDGSISDSSFYETDIWLCREGRWKVAKFHLSAVAG